MIDNCLVSIILPSKMSLSSSLCDFLKSLKETCSCPDRVEILIKIDYEDAQFIKYYKYQLLNSGFSFKLLIGPRLGGYHDVHLFDNDLASISSGKTIWVCADDLVILNGDWFCEIEHVYNMFNDKIFVLFFMEHRGLKGKKQNKSRKISSYPIISRNLYDMCGYIGPDSRIDCYWQNFSIHLGRQIRNDNVLISHNKNSWSGVNVNNSDCGLRSVLSFNDSGHFINKMSLIVKRSIKRQKILVKSGILINNNKELNLNNDYF